MAPAEYFLRLQRGITGGFAPPTPSAIYTLTQSPAQPNTIAVTLATRQDGQPLDAMSEAAPKSLPSSSDSNSLGAEVSALVEELHAILKTLPLEDLRGSEDIYGMDTSIIGGKSMVQASKEEKDKFKRAVDIVGVLVERAEKEGHRSALAVAIVELNNACTVVNAEDDDKFHTPPHPNAFRPLHDFRLHDWFILASTPNSE
ncbi:hypothetical protein C8R45DRAFT_926860 [Mycena sanguinolenta]|nr:hypothetical protein C8R45DRAFT_926860 [Mycena sanguinolenta]